MSKIKKQTNKQTNLTVLPNTDLKGLFFGIEVCFSNKAVNDC